MERLIVSLAGNLGAGKTNLVALHLEEAYDFTTVRPSKLIGEYATKRDLPLSNRQDFRHAFAAMVVELRPDQYINDMLATAGHLCIDGERVTDYVLRLRKHGAIVLALWCPLPERFERVVNDPERAGRDQPTFEAFRDEERAEYDSSEQPGASTLIVMQMADHWVNASQPPSRVLADVDSVIKNQIRCLAV